VRAIKYRELRRMYEADGAEKTVRHLREALQRDAPCPVRMPPLELCTDNAAMVAAAGYFRFQSGQRDTLDLDVVPDWDLVEG